MGLKIAKIVKRNFEKADSGVIATSSVSMYV